MRNVSYQTIVPHRIARSQHALAPGEPVIHARAAHLGRRCSRLPLCREVEQVRVRSAVFALFEVRAEDVLRLALGRAPDARARQAAAQRLRGGASRHGGWSALVGRPEEDACAEPIEPREWCRREVCTLYVTLSFLSYDRALAREEFFSPIRHGRAGGGLQVRS